MDSIKLDDSFIHLPKHIISGGLAQNLDSILLGLESFFATQNMTYGHPTYDKISLEVINHIRLLS